MTEAKRPSFVISIIDKDFKILTISEFIVIVQINKLRRNDLF